MQEHELLPPQIISKLTDQSLASSEEFIVLAMRLWESMAAELIPIIGSDGFNMLFTRTLHLTQPSYVWLLYDTTPQLPATHLAALKICLAGQAVQEAGAACTALLVTLTNILATLIGEPLTTSILRAAWGDDASDVITKKQEPRS